MTMRQNLAFTIVTLPIFLAGCIKLLPTQGTASLTIINAIPTSNPLVTNFSSIGPKATTATALQYYASANQIGYTGFWESGSYSGETSITFSQISDTLATIWSGTVNLAVGKSYSLFLAGDTASVDTLLTMDATPYYPVTDSVAGVRFVNLSTGSGPMTLNLQGNLPTQLEFGNLGYRQSSAFKQYSANSAAQATGVYTYEIRDQATGNLLTTFTWGFTPFRNNTVVISGSEDPSSSTPITVFQVNNY
jgi:hypothetical protein